MHKQQTQRNITLITLFFIGYRCQLLNIHKQNLRKFMDMAGMDMAGMDMAGMDMAGMDK